MNLSRSLVSLSLCGACGGDSDSRSAATASLCQAGTSAEYKEPLTTRGALEPYHNGSRLNHESSSLRVAVVYHNLRHVQYQRLRLDTNIFCYLARRTSQLETSFRCTTVTLRVTAFRVPGLSGRSQTKLERLLSQFSTPLAFPCIK